MAKKFVITATPAGCEMEIRAEADTLAEAHKEAKAIKAENKKTANFQIDIFNASDFEKWEKSGFSQDEFTDAVAGYGSNDAGKWNEW